VKTPIANIDPNTKAVYGPNDLNQVKLNIWWHIGYSDNSQCIAQADILLALGT